MIHAEAEKIIMGLFPGSKVEQHVEVNTRLEEQRTFEFSNASTRPARMEIKAETIPKELIEKARWVCWKWVWKEGENGKPGKWTSRPMM